MAKSDSSAVIVVPTKIELIDVGLIDSSPHNIPGRDKLEIDELAESIRARGLMNPLTLAANNGRYVVIAGHRRLAAIRKIGLAQAPATVRPSESKQDHLVDQLVENLQRADISVMEEAKVYSELQSMGLKQRDIGKQVGKSQPHVAKRLALADLPEEVRDAVDAGGIHVNDAYTLATEFKDDPDTLLRVFHNRTRGNLNFLISAAKRAKEAQAAKAEAGEKPTSTEDDLAAQKDAASKRRLITKLVKLADEARYKALESVIKARVAKTKILDFTLQGLVELVRFPDGGDQTFEWTATILKVNKVQDSVGFGQVWDLAEYIKRNSEENWVRFTHMMVLMRGHLALAGAKEPLTGQEQKFAAVTLSYLSSVVGYKENQGEQYLIGLLEIGEVEPPVKEEKPKAEPKAKKAKSTAVAAEDGATGEIPFQTDPEAASSAPSAEGQE